MPPSAARGQHNLQRGGSGDPHAHLGGGGQRPAAEPSLIGRGAALAEVALSIRRKLAVPVETGNWLCLWLRLRLSGQCAQGLPSSRRPGLALRGGVRRDEEK